MVQSFEGVTPTLGRDVFIAENATVLGDVRLSDQSSVWYGSVLRADVGSISVGQRSNVQELSVIHATLGIDVVIGDDVTIGHRAILHACTIHDRVLVGMGAIVMDGAVIESDCIIGAGALVTQNTIVPSGTMMLGTPARPVRELTEEERDRLRLSSAKYVDLARRHGASERLHHTVRISERRGKPWTSPTQVWRGYRSM